MMKQKTITALKNLVKEMVSREVAKQMKYVIAEITAEPAAAPVKTATQPKYNTVLAREKNLQDEQTNYLNTEPVEEKRYAKDPVLNKILNETKGGIPGEDQAYPTMGGGAYTTQNTDQLASQEMQQMNTATMPDFMKKAMSGHSAKVVQAIEKRHGSKS